MRKFVFVSFAFSLGLALSVSAQTKTVTNYDLEKFRQKRLQAEKDYRENYEKLGFPSPEELARRNEQSRIELEKLSEKLRAERLERERLEAEREAAEANARIEYVGQADPYRPFYGIGGTAILLRGRPFRFRRPKGFQSGYFAAGQFFPRPAPDTRVYPLFRRSTRPR